MPRLAFRYRIEGRVQGVGFRWWVVQSAKALGLTGWVRNRFDGSVEAVAAGEEEALLKFLKACSGGPPEAAVRNIDIELADDDGGEGFEQRETA